VAQRYLSAAVAAPVTVMDTASEGGPWGMALLAAYVISKKEGETLADYLNDRIFASQSGQTLEASQEEICGFETFMERYRRGIPAERSTIEAMDW
ncbi:MAG: ATPase, partial [Blautia sp.]|nr:ATPase [Blautia sp.]